MFIRNRIVAKMTEQMANSNAVTNSNLSGIRTHLKGIHEVVREEAKRVAEMSKDNEKRFDAAISAIKLVIDVQQAQIKKLTDIVEGKKKTKKKVKPTADAVAKTLKKKPTLKLTKRGVR